MIRTGVIGFGVSARVFHLPLLATSEKFEIAAISTSQAFAARSSHPGVKIYPSAEALISSADLDLVIITAPNAVHHELARQCLERGLHVVLEKPMATTWSQATELAALAKRRSLLLSVFHNRRWDGDFLTVSDLLAAKALGEIRAFESHFDRFRPAVRERWREAPGPGAGLLWDLGPHLLDQALCLFGLPDAMTARILNTREGAEVADYFHVMLHYESTEVLLHASSLSAGPNERFKLHGTVGSYVKHGLDPQEAQLRAGMTPLDIEYGFEPADACGTLHTADGEQTVETRPGCYQHYYRDLAEAMSEGAEAPVTAEDGAAVIHLLELAERSQREGLRVEVPGGRT